MTQLEKLYDAIETLQINGLKLPNDLIEQVIEVEEKIIKNDVIPALENAISPIINQIKRELILVVEYSPNQDFTIKLSKKKSFIYKNEDYTEVKETFEIVKKPAKVENLTSRKISFLNKAKKTKLKVTFPDGITIFREKAYETFLEAIKKIGVEKAMAVGLKAKDVKLLDTKKSIKYSQHEISPNVFVVTHSSTATKKSQLEKLSKAVKQRIKVEIIK